MKIKGKLRILINVILIMWLLTCFIKWLDWADVHDTYVAVKSEHNQIILSGGSDEDLKASQSYLDGRATRKFTQFKNAVLYGCISVFLLMAAYFIYILIPKFKKDSLLDKVEVNIIQNTPPDDPLPDHLQQLYPPKKE